MEPTTDNTLALDVSNRKFLEVWDESCLLKCVDRRFSLNSDVWTRLWTFVKPADGRSCSSRHPCHRTKMKIERF